MTSTRSVAVLFGLLAGTSIGSFANVVIDRLPRRVESGESVEGSASDQWTTRPWREVLRGSSRCGACRRRLRSLEIVPVVSWFALRGRCRGCGCRIDAYHPVVEVAVPVLGLLVVLEWGFVWQTALLWWLVVVGVVVSVLDLRTLLVPTRIVWPASCLGAALVVVGALVDRSISVVACAALGIGCVAGPLWFIWWIRPHAMGFGDVRLGGFLGLVLGGVAAGPMIRVIEVVWLSVVLLGLSAVLGLVQAFATLRFRNSAPVPFAPALVTAAFVVSVYSERLLTVLSS